MSINIDNLKPYKRLRRGTDGVVILANNEKYSVKIYRLSPKYIKELIKIMDYLNNYEIPTIYKSYKFLSKKNLLEIYKNKLPNYFSFLDKNNLQKLSESYNMKNRLVEIMKSDETTLNKFLDNYDKENRSIMIESLYYQGILTLLWMYMKKGILHKDLSLDNYFIQKTDNEYFEITIKNINYKVKLYDYYLVLGDFGYSRSLELSDHNEYPDSLNSSVGSSDMNPYYEILNFINIFKRYINIDTDEYILKSGVYNVGNNMSMTSQYKSLMKSYILNENFKEESKKFKRLYFKFINDKVLKI